MNPQIQLLVDNNGGLESFESLRVHIVLLVSDCQLVPGEDILRPQLLLEDTIRTAILLKVALQHVRTFIDLVGRLIYHLIDSDTFEGPLGIPNKATW